VPLCPHCRSPEGGREGAGGTTWVILAEARGSSDIVAERWSADIEGCSGGDIAAVDSVDIYVAAGVAVTVASVAVDEEPATVAGVAVTVAGGAAVDAAVAGRSVAGAVAETLAAPSAPKKEQVL